MRKRRLRKSMKAAWITAARTLAGSSLAVNCWINGTYYVGADGAMSWYGNAEIGVRLDGEYVTEIIDFMAMA